MGRARQNKQPLNSSIVTVTNNSLIDEHNDSTQAASTVLEYQDFIKRFNRPDLEFNQDTLVGCEKTIAALRKRIESFLTSETNRGKFALVTGPSGTGKTTVIKKLAQDFAPELSFFYLRSSWILERQFGNPETRIRQLFDEAIQKAPALIFIDKLDLVCTEKSHDSKDRIFNLLEERLESLNFKPAKVMVLAATSRPEVLDPQVRQPCYFSDEIRFSLPSRLDRIQVMNFLFEKNHQTGIAQEQIESIADSCHCYSHKDLNELYDLAIEHSKELNKPLEYDCFQAALSEFKPVVIKSVTSPCPQIRWDDIGGVDNVKKELQESVIWALQNRHKFKELGITSNKGALLYGPPGCSKTMLAQALATESGFNFISVKGPELFSKWVGDSEAAVRKLYRNARDIAPCIIFFDEIDGLASERDSQSSSVGDRVVAQLLTELDGVEPLDKVFTLAATNRPYRVDSGLLRPGRLRPAIYIPLPSEGDRRAIFKVHMRKFPLGSDNLDEIYNKLAARTSGYSGAEIAEVCRVAGTLFLLENDKSLVDWDHFEEALSKVKSETRAKQLVEYDEFQEKWRENSEPDNKPISNNHLSSQSSQTLPQIMQSSQTLEVLQDSQETQTIAVSKGSSASRLHKLMRSLSINKTKNK